MDSVRAAVEPLNTALDRGPTIFLVASFAGLPLINPALAAENPLGGDEFFVTLRALIKVLGMVPIQSVLDALAQAHTPPPKPPPVPPTPTPTPTPPATPPTPAVLCFVEMYGDDPGFGGITNIRVYGGGMLPMETVDINENQRLSANAVADSLGSFSVHFGVLESQFPVLHSFQAVGEKSHRASNMAGITI